MTNIIHTLSRVRRACRITGTRFILLRDDDYFYMLIVAYRGRHYRMDLIGNESAGQIAYIIRGLVGKTEVVR